MFFLFQPMPKIEQNSQGFKYIITWKRADEADAQETSWQVDLPEAWHYVVWEKFDKPYIPFYITVKASNAMGEATVAPRTIMGYSGEDGRKNKLFHILIVPLLKRFMIHLFYIFIHVFQNSNDDNESHVSEPEIYPMDVAVLDDSVHSTQAELTWTPIDEDPEKINGFFRGYRVQFAKADEWPENIREQVC